MIFFYSKNFNVPDGDKDNDDEGGDHNDTEKKAEDK